MSLLFKRPIRTGDLIDLWLREKRDKVKDSSWQHYRCITEARLRPIIGQCMAHKLNDRTIGDLIRYWEANGNGGAGLSAATIRDILTVLRCVLRFGVEKGFACKPPKLRYAGKDAHARLEIPTAITMNKLERFLLSHMSRPAFGILLCMYTGLRIGEICALRWMDIDGNEGVMQINHTLQRVGCGDGSGKTHVVLGTPKSSSSRRTLPIPAWLLPLTAELRVDRKDTDYVISDRAGKPVEPRAYSYRFHKYLKAAGVTPMRFHMLRHFFATTSIDAGVDAKTLADMLGHADVQTTMRIYVHPTMEMKRAGIEQTVRFRRRQTERAADGGAHPLKYGIS